MEVLGQQWERQPFWSALNLASCQGDDVIAATISLPGDKGTNKKSRLLQEKNSDKSDM